jgi:hypothetical protein
VLDPGKLYSGDNGRVFCGEHAGASAKYTGRDISGQRVAVLTAAELEDARVHYGALLRCEHDGCDVWPRLVVAVKS